MSFKDALLALCVIIIWGLNFIAMKLGLDDMPPFLLGGLRFLLVFFPAILFVPPPRLAFKWLIAYSLASFGQFALLFYAMSMGMPSGVASLVLQSQVIFTVLLGVVFFKERLQSAQIIGGGCGSIRHGPAC